MERVKGKKGKEGKELGDYNIRVNKIHLFSVCVLCAKHAIYQQGFGNN